MQRIEASSDAKSPGSSPGSSVEPKKAKAKRRSQGGKVKSYKNLGLVRFTFSPIIMEVENGLPFFFKVTTMGGTHFPLP